MTRVILAPNDLLTPFDLRAQNFRVNVEFSTINNVDRKFFRKYVQNWPIRSKTVPRWQHDVVMTASQIKLWLIIFQCLWNCRRYRFVIFSTGNRSFSIKFARFHEWNWYFKSENEILFYSVLNIFILNLHKNQHRSKTNPS